VGFFLPPANGQSASSAGDEKELRKLEMDVARLEQQNDPGIAKLLAEDWICVGQRLLSKKEFIENVKRNLDSYTIVKENIQVHLFGETAVVTSVKVYRQTPDTTKFFNEDDTDVFTREAGVWRLRFTRVAPVQTQTSAN
jgi:hypothetical protein